ncbi:DUF5309 domain-containing protein [Paenibacillus albicereus]|uniref:DUF5309 domain-containing protein n=1 Tax=Paenibacillus albicereus TaxID=2726185 RepID=A0A6H2GZP2_9BACL|nr:DUF5309 family protein [Paenibacillus albicereus]QJC52903.1 DUF5309 domain-containing protein [Paenibacillus albicereus]
MPPVTTGVRDTLNIGSSKVVVDMSDTIGLLQPNAEPFMSFLKIAKRNTETANSPKFEWLEDDLLPRWDAINLVAGYTASDTSMVVDNGAYFSPNDIIKVPRTGEVMLVKTVNSGTNTITVGRGYGLTAAAAIVNDDPLVIIGNANQEGSGTRELKSTQEVPRFNYTQIFKTPFGVTGTENATKMYGGKDLAYQQAKGGAQHKIDIARSYMFGEKKLDTSGAKPLRTTGGLLSFLTKNNYDAGGQLTATEFDNNISETVFKYGSKEKILLCSARLLTVLNSWAMNKLEVDQQAKEFGLDIKKYITPFGTYNLMNYQHILEGAVYGGYGVIIDPANVKHRPLAGRDTKLETNIQANDLDARVDQYITEAGLEVRNPETHAVLTGVTS